MEAFESPSPKPTGWAQDGIRVVSSSSATADSSSSPITSVNTDTTRRISIASLPTASAPSSEQCELMNFAYALGAEVKNNDPSFVDNNGVRREAKLLMSLSTGPSSMSTDNNSLVSDGEESSAASQHHHHHHHSNSGRITPQSVTSASMSSGGSRARETFCFTCPSLSLEGGKDANSAAITLDGSHSNKIKKTNKNASEDRDGEVQNATAMNKDNKQEGTAKSNGSSSSTCPAVMLGRTLKVDDKDVTRLSADAMARNIMQSFQTAMEWRIQSWVDSLSTVLVKRERQLHSEAASPAAAKAAVDALCYSNEALLVAALRQIAAKIQVLETSTEFKVLHKVTNRTAAASMSKRQRLVEEERNSLEEGEYVYDALHVLEMQCFLTVSTLAGNVNIDFNVPGTIKGTFLSSEDTYNDELTDVNINVNTAMLATMIERSSRIAVRCSAEALLKGEIVGPSKAEGEKKEASTVEAATTPSPKAATLSPKTTFHSPLPTATATSTRSPKRKLFADEDQPVSGLVVITPARDAASSPSTFADSDSDGDHKPDKLQIPDNFSRSNNSKAAVLSPQPSRTRQEGGTPELSFASRLPPKKSYNPVAGAVVTPMKTVSPEFEHREKGPAVPLLELASAAALNSTNK